MIFKHFLRINKGKQTYLDFASSAPVDRSMLFRFPFIPSHVLRANPSALHKDGVAAKKALEDVRTLVAKALHAHKDEIIYTSSATESDNIAILGSVNYFLRQGMEPHEIAVFVSSIEHAAVTESLETVGREKVQTGYIPAPDGVVNPHTIIVPDGVKAMIISVMYVNNEIGTVQPIAAIAKRIRYLRKQYPDVVIHFHVDATQAPLFYELNVAKLGVDLLTLGATKLYCTKGVGLLYKKRTVHMDPVLHGGGQERGLRPGTEPLSLIHEFSHALLYAQERVAQATEKTKELQSYFEHLLSNIPSVVVTAKDMERTPHITHVAIEGFDSELLVLELDARGIEVSAKSACKNEEGNESEIVRQIYGQSVGAIRFSFGRTTKKRHLKKAIKALKQVLRKYKK